MKRFTYLFAASMLCALALSACGGAKTQVNNGPTGPEQYKTEYVGDAPNVIGVVGSLAYPEGYSYESIEIQSFTEPYGLTVFLTVDPESAGAVSEADFQNDADKTFELIGNLGTLEYKDSQSKELLATFSR